MKISKYINIPLLKKSETIFLAAAEKWFIGNEIK